MTYFASSPSTTGVESDFDVEREALRSRWRDGSVGLRGAGDTAAGGASASSAEGVLRGSSFVRPPSPDAPVMSVEDFMASREICAYVTGKIKEPDIAALLPHVRPDGVVSQDDLDIIRRFEVERTIEPLNPGTRADDALTFFRALALGNSMLGDRLPRPTTPDYREAVRILSDLESRDPDNGIYAFHKIAMLHAMGEDPEAEYRKFVESKTFRSPAEDVLRAYENFGRKSPHLFLKAMGMYSISDVPNSKPSTDWIRERVETMDEGEKDALDAKADGLMKEFIQRGSDTYTLPYAFMGRIRRTIGGGERPEYRPTHYFENRRKSYEPKEFASAAEKLRADVCDDRDFVRVFEGAKLGFDSSIEF